jgi:hypothetical protein
MNLLITVPWGCDLQGLGRGSEVLEMVKFVVSLLDVTIVASMGLTGVTPRFWRRTITYAGAMGVKMMGDCDSRVAGGF